MGGGGGIMAVGEKNLKKDLGERKTGGNYIKMKKNASFLGYQHKNFRRGFFRPSSPPLAVGRGKKSISKE